MPLPVSRSHEQNENTRLLEARAARLRTPAVKELQLFASVVTFRRALGHYALSLTDLREIRGLTKICHIPGANPIVPGLVHYRGELLSLHDLAVFSGSPPKQAAAWILVAEHEGRRIGVLADEVLDVVDIEVGAMQAIPLTLGEFGDVFAGMTRERVLVLDAPRLFQSSRFISAF